MYNNQKGVSMGLIDTLINNNYNNEDRYRIGNLYVGYIYCNSEVQLISDNEVKVYGDMRGPIICYKPTLSNIYTRVSNGVKYLKECERNNSLMIGDSYFKIRDNLLDFAHKHMTGFEKVVKTQYMTKEDIAKLELLLQENIVFISPEQEQL